MRLIAEREGKLAYRILRRRAGHDCHSSAETTRLERQSHATLNRVRVGGLPPRPLNRTFYARDR
jgi:hypothetical protein